MPSIIAIVIAVIAVAVAIGAWFRPAPKPETPAAKTYSEQEVADAKKAVCETFKEASTGIQAAGGRTGGDDPTAVLAVAVNVRLALSAASSYLIQGLDANPATPQELAKPIRDLAKTYQEIAILQLGDAPHEKIDPLYTSGDEATAKIKQVCG
ncbi:hypothetical protein Y900_015325 [Mycolicibacterium aromaticivorans JS19b1 = JCM 16368]|uniref:Alanine and proline rich membrane protein n=1 Tax=Mycolicibacterium aromaticivorans JS19b1 = JCM 16368 TaxID=1440774 RepID=A0A064CNA0_9MYCO|nr:hypothetical protein [Mycolicibacterium aromaticivorans]KDF00273.1 hypothetical protein Y900_015325 [Mycolicibacterium aromaticivorans JS19b1 = JCM 16368]